MRTASVNIGEGSYPAAFSLRVLAHLDEKTGKPAIEALDALLDGGRVTDTAWLLAELLAAGAQATGSTERTPTADELLDQLALDDLHTLTASVLASTKTVKPLLEVERKKPETKLRRALRTLFG